MTRADHCKKSSRVSMSDRWRVLLLLFPIPSVSSVACAWEICVQMLGRFGMKALDPSQQVQPHHRRQARKRVCRSTCRTRKGGKENPRGRGEEEHQTYRPRSVSSLLIRFSAIVSLLLMRGWYRISGLSLGLGIPKWRLLFFVVVFGARLLGTKRIRRRYLRRNRRGACQRGMTRKSTEPADGGG